MGRLPLSPSTLLLRHVLSLELDELDQLTSRTLGPPSSIFPALVVQTCTTAYGTQLFTCMEFSSSWECRKTSPTEPSPQPPDKIFFKSISIIIKSEQGQIGCIHRHTSDLEQKITRKEGTASGCSPPTSLPSDPTCFNPFIPSPVLTLSIHPAPEGLLIDQTLG